MVLSFYVIVIKYMSILTIIQFHISFSRIILFKLRFVFCFITFFALYFDKKSYIDRVVILPVFFEKDCLTYKLFKYFTVFNDIFVAFI